MEEDRADHFIEHGGTEVEATVMLGIAVQEPRRGAEGRHPRDAARPCGGGVKVCVPEREALRAAVRRQRRIARLPTVDRALSRFGEGHQPPCRVRERDGEQDRDVVDGDPGRFGEVGAKDGRVGGMRLRVLMGACAHQLLCIAPRNAACDD
eukprot:SAG11_NODE_232_length_11930_cov_6.884794_5_plen_151_part_00